jgi:Ca-activated chloride channel family protein
MDIRDAGVAVTRQVESTSLRTPTEGRPAGVGDELYSRLERGLFIARECIISVGGARFAAAIGRARGYVAVPLTFDNEAAIIFLETLDGSSMTGRSTNLEALLDAAAAAFQSTSAARRVIVLISDGEALTGVLRNAINRCIMDGIIVNTIAVGSDEGREIFSRADDPQSPVVISRRDAAAMRSAAERTGGIYIDGSREDASQALSSHLLSLAHEMEPEQRAEGTGRREPRQRRTLFIMLALIAYGASKFVTRQSHKSPRSLIRRLPVVSIIAIFLLSSCSQGKLHLMEANFFHSRGRYEEALTSYLKALNYDDAAPYAEYGLGLTFYLLDQGETAFSRFKNSQRMLEMLPENEHRELRFRNHYNSGILFFEDGNYYSAVVAFREALRADPRRIDAKRNLELSLLSISMESSANNQTDSSQEQREILFDYLRDEEQQLWRSPEWIPEDDHTGPDY